MAKKKSLKSGVDAVFFDMGKVLLHFDFTQAMKRLARDSGKTPRQVEGFFHDSGLEVLYDGGKISSRHFYREVAKGVGLKMSYREFQKVWNDIFTPITPMIRLAKRLRGRVKLALISNTNRMHYEHVRARYTFLEVFDHHVLSFKEKIRKPDPKIYRKALKHCRTRPENAFYIDDRQDLTQAADEIGLHTHTFRNDAKAVEARLKAWGLL